jgi:hypothetical protein
MTTTLVDRLAGVAEGLGRKAPVRVATTANIGLFGLQTIDGVALSAGDRVLVKNQTSGSANGIYTASVGAWSRALDFNGTRDVVQGTAVLVASGTINQHYEFHLSTPNPITIGTTALTFVLVGGTTELYVNQQDAALADILRGEIEEADTFVLQQAGSYADEQDAANLQAAKDYADDQDTAVGTYILSQSGQYADSQIAYLRDTYLPANAPMKAAGQSAFDAINYRIKNLAAPAADNDGARKIEVDTAFAGAIAYANTRGSSGGSLVSVLDYVASASLAGVLAGTTDVSAAITAALAAHPAPFLPPLPGVEYLLDAPITIPTNKGLWSSGATIKHGPSVTSGALISGGAQGSFLAGIKINGNMTAIGAGFLSAEIAFGGTTGRNRLSNVEVTNFRYIGIDAAGLCDIDDPIITGNATSTAGSVFGIWYSVAGADVCIRGGRMTGLRLNAIFAGGTSRVYGTYFADNHKQTSPNGGGHVATGAELKFMALFGAKFGPGGSSACVGIELDNAPMELHGCEFDGQLNDAIVLQSGSGHRIVGGTIKNSVGKAIRVAAGVSGFQILGVKAFDDQLVKTQTWGLHIDDGASDVFVVQGNDFSGNINAAGLYNGATGTTQTVVNNLPSGAPAIMRRTGQTDAFTYDNSATDAGGTATVGFTLKTAGTARWSWGQSIAALNGNFDIYSDGAAAAVSIAKSTGNIAFKGAPGFNGAAPFAKPTLPATATDAATTMALANAIRSALISYGLAS